jgi:hypothetical protein
MPLATIGRRLIALPLLLLGLLAAGCENPVGGDGEHPEGLVVLNAQGGEVARYMLPNVQTGTITVAAGSTTDLRVALLTAAGVTIAIDNLEYSLRAPTVVLSARGAATLVGIDGMRIVAGTPGSTTIVIPVWHGNHREFDAVVRLTVQ